MHIGFTYVYLGFGGLIHIGPLISPLIAFCVFLGIQKLSNYRAPNPCLIGRSLAPETPSLSPEFD